MKRAICTWPDEVLSAVAEPVKEITPELRELIKDMVETMYEDKGVGLAAPQVGQSIRLICVDPSGPDERTGLRVLINPEIQEREGEVDSEEGCLSCPEFTLKVKRNKRVRVTALDEHGEEVEIDTDEFLAVVLQHEIDHLDGVTIADKASRLKKAMYKKKASKWK